MSEIAGCPACGSTMMYGDQDGDPHCLTCGRSFPRPRPPRKLAPAPLGRSGHPKLGPEVPTRSVEVLATAIMALLEEEGGPLSWRQMFGRLQGRGGEERANFDLATQQLVQQEKARWLDVDGRQKLEEADRWAEREASRRSA
jgi:hypothetical protein